MGLVLALLLFLLILLIVGNMAVWLFLVVVRTLLLIIAGFQAIGARMAEERDRDERNPK